jgi:limonene 1,2-monooxygenase
MSRRQLKFGVFIAPYHKPGVNPTVLYEDDLRLVQELDALGYDEAWFGEHHSGGTEIIGAPEISCALALDRTKNIKVGTGVISASYHNPLWVAERAVQIDHLSRGRFILGLGPGALPSDMDMIGIEPHQSRALFQDAVEIITRLLRGETVSFENDRWQLRDAFLQVAPYSDPYPEIVIAAVGSPSGPMAAGRFGHGLLSIGAATAGADMLGMHWNVMEERAAKFNTQVDRRNWRLQGVMHIAETREQAYEDVKHGIEQFFDYATNVAAFALQQLGEETFEVPDGAGPSALSADDYIRIVNESGFGVIGTPDDAIRMIERLWQDSNGGFGTYLLQAQDWARPAAKFRHFELFARHVMPHFQGQWQSLLESEDRARARRPQLIKVNTEAVREVRRQYEREIAGEPPSSSSG